MLAVLLINQANKCDSESETRLRMRPRNEHQNESDKMKLLSVRFIINETERD